LGIARRCYSTVSLLHVVNAPIYGMTADGLAAAVDRAKWDAEQLHGQLDNEHLLDGLTLDIMISVGSVWPTIADAIREKNAGLLVLGTHGRSGLGKFVLGSVAESAFREAPCPVFTVGPNLEKSKYFGAESKYFLVSTDLSPESTNALRYGLSLARAVDGEVLLLHILPPQKGEVDAGSNPVEQVKGWLDEFLGEHPGAAKMVSARAEFGDPEQCIVNIAEQTRADLIVMGVRAWSIESSPMWRTAYHVLTQATCPVLSMKVPALSSPPPAMKANPDPM